MPDTCPRCSASGIAPASERRHAGQVIHGYACTCGHRWATSRMVDAYPAPAASPSKPECPTPGKHRYATPEAAARVSQQTQPAFGKRLNPYQCRCGWVHLTSLADPARYATGVGQ